MKNFQENVVPAENQNEHNAFFHGKGKVKLMFVGNSITIHGKKPEIGWDRECGMAASSIEKDYVHLVVKMFEEYLQEEISWCITGISYYERELDPALIPKMFYEVENYNPDYMIMFFGANVPTAYDNDPAPKFKFGDSYEKVRNYLAGENAKVYHSQGFYIRPVLDAEKEAVAKKCGDTFINIEDIRNRADTYGAFNHPGDIGMQAIAERFWETIKKDIDKLKFLGDLI